VELLFGFVPVLSDRDIKKKNLQINMKEIPGTIHLLPNALGPLGKNFNEYGII
jgi:hypothetical protein